MGDAPFARAAENVEVDEAERRRKLGEAIAFLQRALVGGRCPAHAVLREAAHAGIAERTLYHRKRDAWDRKRTQRLCLWAWGEDVSNAERRSQTMKTCSLCCRRRQRRNFGA